MTPYYADPWLTVYAGDCRAVMAEMPAQSVHCVVTSPPYWGLRDYGTATWVGGNDPLCDHAGRVQPESGPVNGVQPPVTRGGSLRDKPGHYCGKCGAGRVDGQIGLEPTPEQYVETMVAVFREVRRVLRDDGTVWLNLGDSYAGSSQSGGTDPSGLLGYGNGGTRDVRATFAPPRGLGGLKPKDLVGIPWRVAFALQADGWYLRSDIVWSKPNPMPESVTDRPTKSHEYVFLLSKRERYYFDADAVRQGFAETTLREYGDGRLTVKTAKHKNEYGHGGLTEATPNPAGRNLRSVWTIATQPYPGAHFATFPEALVEPCVKAGTSERGVCPDHGAPWVRLTRREGGERYATGKSAEKNGAGLATAFSGYTDGSSAPTFVTLDWCPSCGHDAESVPATVLDPFAGSGTTGRVAQRLGRRAILIDLNPAYLVQAMVRNRDIPLGLGFGPTEDAA